MEEFVIKRLLLRTITSSSTKRTSTINQLITDAKWYEEIRELTIEQGEDYTTGCLLDYDYIKNHYRLIAICLSRKK